MSPAPDPVATFAPRAAEDDPHALVLAESDDFHCQLVGVDGGTLYVASDDALYGLPVGGGPRRTVLRGAMSGSLRVAHGVAIRREPGEHFLERYHLVSLEDGTTRMLGEAIYVTAWTADATNVYWADNKYDEPRIWALPFVGGESTRVEELAAVGNEDRIERITVRDGKATLLVDRTWLNTDDNRGCHEIRHGRLGKTRMLWRDRACVAGSIRGGRVQGVATSPGYVYFSHEDALRRVALRGGRPEVVFDRDAFAHSVWSDDRWLVWSNNRKLLRVRLPRGRGATPTSADELAEDVVQGNAIHVHDGYLYWTQRRAEGPCQIRRRPLDAPGR